METEINYNQEKKDRREWAVMQIFRSEYPVFPLGELSKSERPDFLLQSKKGLIGIELTELKYERQDKKFNLRAHEDFLSEIMEGAQEIFESKCDQKLVVDVHFANELGPILSAPYFPEKDETLMKQGLMEAIAKIVIDNMPESTGVKYKVDRTSKYGDLNLPSKIESIYILNVTGRFEEALWYAGISTMVKPLSIESISQRLRAKDLKLPFYNSESVENWLIIIQNSFLMSSSYDPITAQKALKHCYSSQFDRVFVFERSEGGITQLRTKKRPKKG
ncbi:MAG: hypothetical protein MJZ33_08475 [Paludibacteraceae bacterium]|nr:hypothetical protein [Paludibacteraceae bacterium]